MIDSGEKERERNSTVATYLFFYGFHLAPYLK